MKRVAIATAWVWVALAQPAGVYARATPVDLAALRGGLPAMCAQTPSAQTPVLRFAVERVAAPQTPQTPQTPLDDGPIAWCSTPDDPRCSSRDASSLPGYGNGQVPLNSAGVLLPPGPRARDLAPRVLRATQLGAARDGQGLRVERPPRTARRHG